MVYFIRSGTIQSCMFTGSNSLGREINNMVNVNGTCVKTGCEEMLELLLTSLMSLTLGHNKWIRVAMNVVICPSIIIRQCHLSVNYCASVMWPALYMTVNDIEVFDVRAPRQLPSNHSCYSQFSIKWTSIP